MADETKPPEPLPAGVPVTLGPKWLGWLKWAVWVATTVAAVGSFVLSWQQTGKTPALPDIPPLPFDVQPVGQGWVNDPDEVQAVEATLPEGERRFRDTPAGKARLGPDDDVFLWDACRKVTGDLLPPRNQGGVGSCVAFGTVAAVEHLLCVQIARDGGAEFRPLAQEVIYGGSRVEVGGGRVRGDGSVGAWAAQFVKGWGVIPRGVHQGYDLSTYNEARCRQYGQTGVPDPLEPLAKESPVKGVAKVTTGTEAVQALRQGYPLIVCSDQGFAMQRDADGFARPSGQWMHCMAIVGYQAAPRKGYFILNSWGATAHTGPVGKGNPSPAGFWADARTVERMLSQGDSWAFSDAKGFPQRALDWSRLPAPKLRLFDPFAPAVFALAP
jgi:hypothetical protein